MPDIRLVRPRSSKLLAVLGALIALGILAWSSSYVFGDATAEKQRGIGARSGLGEVRAPVIPMRSAGFETVAPIEQKDLGRLVRFTGTTETRMVAGAVWARADDRRRILLRWEPLPAGTSAPAIGPGARIQVDGYIQRISRAEFDMWADSVGAAIPRPRPGAKFGETPDTSFAQVEALFVKDYYMSVRPSIPGPVAQQ
ncbi:MAG: hypothetical protein H0X52_00890 [Gemmatimonadetes bacterium]|nr:hypothetical protein [Gemmatimonadota bacterium]